MAHRIQYASDLHLEFPENRKFLNKYPLQAVGDILVLAGDIVPFALLDQHKDFFDYVSANFETTYWLPGNHEYYHFDAVEKCGVLNEKIRSNVFLVNNFTVQQQNTSLVFTTLWSKISTVNQWSIQQQLNDFHQIKYKGSPLSTEQYNLWFEDSLAFIKQALMEHMNQKVAVFSHHVPTFLNYPEQYKGDALNEAFAVELFDLIEKSNIDYWVFGHHHSNTGEFNIGKTKMLTNQLGYVRYKENLQFERNKVFKLTP